MQLSKIVVPTDFSADADAAVDVALDLARASGAAVTLVHVCHLPAHVVASAGPFAPRAMATLVSEATAALAREQAERGTRGQHVEVACIEGDPRDAIVRWAAQQHADLIVMGRRGRRGLKRLLHLSVAARVVRTSRLPVVTVHAAAPSSPAPGPG